MANGQCVACGQPVYSYNTIARGVRTASRCSACINAMRRETYSPRTQRSYSLKKRYGITADEFDEMLAKQGGCAACGAIETDGKYWHVDHDHECCPTQASSCGKCIRGILCHGCNTALGNVKDSPARLRALIEYLER